MDQAPRNCRRVLGTKPLFRSPLPAHSRKRDLENGAAIALGLNDGTATIKVQTAQLRLQATCGLLRQASGQTHQGHDEHTTEAPSTNAANNQKTENTSPPWLTNAAGVPAATYSTPMATQSSESSRPRSQRLASQSAESNREILDTVCTLLDMRGLFLDPTTASFAPGPRSASFVLRGTRFQARRLNVKRWHMTCCRCHIRSFLLLGPDLGPGWLTSCSGLFYGCVRGLL